MTPGPPKTKILDTSFKSPPSAANPEGSLWDAPARISTEMNQTYQDTPDLLTPKARQWVGDNLGWFGRNIAGPAVDVGSFVTKEGSALGAGALAAASEILSGGNPQLTRDIHAGLQVLPVAQANAPPMVRPMVAKEPSYTGSLTPTQMQYTPTTIAGPTGPIYPPEAVPIKTPADALKVAQGSFKAADASNFQLTPQFTNDWVASLDQYNKQTPAGLVTSGPNPMTDLVTNLRKATSAPLDSIQSIQEVDKTIQDAISDQYKDGVLSPAGRQMKQLQQDFRARYTNPSPDQFTGSPQGIQSFKDGMQGYAAYSRMRDLQGIVDSTEGNPNRATLIASRTNAFLNDPTNVAGWTPDEIASARKAANSGFLQEWMRAEGSRLVGIGAAVTGGGLTGALTAVPAQVGLSYAVRNAAENTRIAQLQKAMAYLGQRVPQPGTVPPQPPPFIPSRTAVTSARYAPLVGLLGQQQDQNTPDKTIFPSIF
jgi:hypothetical protein